MERLKRKNLNRQVNRLMHKKFQISGIILTAFVFFNITASAMLTEDDQLKATRAQLKKNPTQQLKEKYTQLTQDLNSFGKAVEFAHFSGDTDLWTSPQGLALPLLIGIINEGISKGKIPSIQEDKIEAAARQAWKNANQEEADAAPVVDVLAATIEYKADSLEHQDSD
jgi:hypothetical protein